MDEKLNFISGTQLLEICEERNITIGEAMILREEVLFGTSREEQWERMRHSWSIMKEAATRAATIPSEIPARYFRLRSYSISSPHTDH